MLRPGGVAKVLGLSTGKDNAGRAVGAGGPGADAGGRHQRSDRRVFNQAGPDGSLKGKARFDHALNLRMALPMAA